MQTLVNQLMAWQLHPVADHYTVALIIIAILVDLVGSLIPSRTWIRQMAVTLMVLGAIAAAASNLTGGWEADRLEKLITGPAKRVLETHERLGDILPWVIGGLALWRLGIQFIGFLAGSRALYLLVAIAAGGTILYQGHEGGELVYTYGVGTAVMPTEAASPTPVPSESATPAEAAPIPTVYVPPATPTPGAMNTPAPAASPGEAGSPGAAVTPALATPVAEASPAVPAASTTPAAMPSAAPSGGTPVNPPPGGEPPHSAPASPGAAKSL
jgi:uncharacterized membrane protein